MSDIPGHKHVTTEELKLFNEIKCFLNSLNEIKDIELHSDGIDDTGIIGFFFNNIRYYLVISNDRADIYASTIPKKLVVHFKQTFPNSIFKKQNAEHFFWEGVHFRVET